MHWRTHARTHTRDNAISVDLSGDICDNSSFKIFWKQDKCENIIEVGQHSRDRCCRNKLSYWEEGGAELCGSRQNWCSIQGILLEPLSASWSDKSHINHARLRLLSSSSKLMVRGGRLRTYTSTHLSLEMFTFPMAHAQLLEDKEHLCNCLFVFKS